MKSAAIPIPVLEIGGTHVTAATVDPTTWTVAGPRHRVEVDSGASAELILEAFISAGRCLGAADGVRWAVAMPDPFDYVRGIGRFRAVGKFEALDGVDVGAALRCRLGAGTIAFCNDADAFTMGEWVAGAAAGTARAVGLTLGTGVGSGWVEHGWVVDPGLPPGGRAHLLHVDGVALEEVMSRRAIRRQYALATKDYDADVRVIADRARAGESAASAVLADAFHALGRVLAPAVRDFAADVLVVGGSMSQSWDLFEPWFRAGARGVPLPPLRVAADLDGAALIGAAYLALDH